MMIAPPVQTVSLEAFIAFIYAPENANRDFEYIAGEIVDVVSNPKSSKLGVRLSSKVEDFVDLHQLGHVTGADGGYWVMGERYIPDVGFIRFEKQPTLDDISDYIPHAPDLAVEVLSPSDDARLTRIKLSNYLAAGTVVWLVDPIRKTIEVHAQGKAVQTFRVGDTLDGGDVLPGLAIRLADVFR